MENAVNSSHFITEAVKEMAGYHEENWTKSHLKHGQNTSASRSLVKITGKQPLPKNITTQNNAAPQSLEEDAKVENHSKSAK